MFEGKGYIGQAMSVNAYEAHENDELPISHWTKKKMLAVIKNLGIDTKLLKKLTKNQLQDVALTQSSWHHTGKFYNQTEFYSINEKLLKELTNEETRQMILDHKKYLEETKEKRRIEREKKEKQRLENKKRKEYKEEIESMIHLSAYKTLNGLLKGIESGKVDLKELRNLKKEEDKERKEKQFLSVAGQIRKKTDYKNVQDMFDDYKSGILDKQIVEMINEITYLNF